MHMKRLQRKTVILSTGSLNVSRRLGFNAVYSVVPIGLGSPHGHNPIFLITAPQPHLILQLARVSSG